MSTRTSSAREKVRHVDGSGLKLGKQLEVNLSHDLNPERMSISSMSDADSLTKEVVVPERLWTLVDGRFQASPRETRTKQETAILKPQGKLT